jgi:hypothetical protein
MDTATLSSTGLAGASLVKDRATTGTTFDVLLRATVATRFRVRDRWLIAGSFPTEAAARQEYGALGREFPAETVSLMLVRCEAEDSNGNFRERVLDKREAPPPGPQRRVLRPAASPRAEARSRGEPPKRQVAPQPKLPSNAALHWQLVGGLVAATLLLTWLLG